MRIIPAILTANTDELNKELNYISEFTDEVDIDLMDGVFVQDKSVDINDLPILKDITYNLDLMVENPIEDIEKVLMQQQKGLKVERIFVHIESNFDIVKLCTLSRNNFKLGFSLMVPTAIENFLDIVTQVQKSFPDIYPLLQLKTVQIGKQGNPYHPEVLGKIIKARSAGFKGDVYIDGGIDPDIIMSIKNYEITGVSVGSYISKTSDPMKAFTQLRNATWKNRID